MAQRLRMGRQWLPAGAVILLFLCLGIWNSLVVPPFEKPDELYHYAFVRHLGLGNPLPVQGRTDSGLSAQEASQAPLYYLLAGRLTAGIDQGDFPELIQRDSFANVGNPLSPGSKNFLLHSAKGLPLQGTNLAVHVDRWLSLLLACLTLWFTYRTAQLAFPGNRSLALFSVLIVAAIPQFGFISTSVSNDSLVVTASAAVIWRLAVLVSRPDGERARWWEWGWLGAWLGIAALGKVHGLGLAVPIAAAALWLACRQRSWRMLPGAFVAVALPALAIAGWWYWRNHVLYGEWLGTHTLWAITGGRHTQLTLGSFLGELRGLRYSFWGLFGWFSIMLPVWVYQALDGLTAVAMAGLLYGLLRRWRGRRPLLGDAATRVLVLAALWALTLVGLTLYAFISVSIGQGRLLFPALNAFAILTAAGLWSLTSLLPQRWRLPALGLVPLGLLACSVYSLAVLLPASYYAPPPVAAVPATATPVGVTNRAGIELLAVEVPSGRFAWGDDVPVTLYLRSRTSQTVDWPLFVQILDENRGVLGNVTSHAGWGRNPTSLWQPGAIYRDQYTVQLTHNPGDRSPLLAAVYTGFLDATTRLPLPATSADGAPADGFVATVQVAPSGRPDVAAEHLAAIDATFGNTIHLAGYGFPAPDGPGPRTLPVRLLWQAVAAPGADYTAFVHVQDAGGALVAGFDQPPAGSRFPSRYWQPGDRVVTELSIPLPAGLKPGLYEVWVGLYESASQGDRRLAVSAPARRVADQRVLLDSVEVK